MTVEHNWEPQLIARARARVRVSAIATAIARSTALPGMARRVVRFVDTQNRRSTLSCNECRRRKKRCDETRPQCQACKRRKVKCVFAEKAPPEREIARELELEDKENENDHAEACSMSVIVLNESISKPLKTPELQVQVQPSSFLSTTPPINSPSNFNFIISPTFHTNIPDFTIDPISISAPLITWSPNMNFDLAHQSDEEIDSIARQIVDSTICMTNNVKFSKSFAILLPLTYTSRSILITLAAWILNIQSTNDFALRLLDLSLRISRDIEYRIDYIGGWNEDDLIEYITLLTCHTLISGALNDTQLWKCSFERLYYVLRKIGLDMIINMLNKPQNRDIFNWVINWFFYQDVLKMIKVTNNRVLGPMFSKNEYMKFITAPTKGTTNVDTVWNRCVDSTLHLLIAMGEINALYDLYALKIRKPIDHYLTNIKPKLDELEEIGAEDALIEYVNSEEYLHYEHLRSEFHDWIHEKTAVLELRIRDCEINGVHGKADTDVDVDMDMYFNAMKLSVLLYMKFKLKELSATSWETKQLVLQIFKRMRWLLADRTKAAQFCNQLSFPLLMLGANVCEERDRVMIRGFYKKLTEASTDVEASATTTTTTTTTTSSTPSSVTSSATSGTLQQVWKMILEFWELNPNGVSFDSWQNIINKYDWNVCII